MHTVLSYTRTYESFHRAYARAIFAVLVALLLVSVCAYGYFLKSASFSAAQWEENRVAIGSLSGDVAELETEYLNRIQSLGIDEARTFGLSDTKITTFVERGSRTKLTFADGGRKSESQ